jgi:hypothetical protein
MFPEEVKKVMSSKFTILLADIVECVDDPNSLVQKLRLLGPMHVKRGVRIEHMVPMGEALIWTIEKVRLGLGGFMVKGKCRDLRKWCR